MTLQRLATLSLFVFAVCYTGFAQKSEVSKSEVSVSVGRTFVSTQTIPGATFFNHDIHFGDGISFSFNYAYKWRYVKGMGLKAELPVMFSPDTDLNTGQNIVPASYKGLFITPSLRLNFFPDSAVSPWISGGGGYARFKEAGHLVFSGPNPGPTTTNTGAAQFGAGLDVVPWRGLGFRFEARDFFSGHPDLLVDTSRSMQHNYYVGSGILLRF